MPPGCQPCNDRPENVINASFDHPGSSDWAVLCSVNGISTILVFWNGSENNPDALVPAADSNYVQGAGGDQWVYSLITAWVGDALVT